MILPYFIIIPLLAAFLIAVISGKKDIWAINISGIAVTAVLVLSVYAFFNMGSATVTYAMSGWDIPIGIQLVLDTPGLRETI